MVLLIHSKTGFEPSARSTILLVDSHIDNGAVLTNLLLENTPKNPGSALVWGSCGQAMLLVSWVELAYSDPLSSSCQVQIMDQ